MILHPARHHFSTILASNSVTFLELILASISDTVLDALGCQNGSNLDPKIDEKSLQKHIRKNIEKKTRFEEPRGTQGRVRSNVAAAHPPSHSPLELNAINPNVHRAEGALSVIRTRKCPPFRTIPR